MFSASVSVFPSAEDPPSPVCPCKLIDCHCLSNIRKQQSSRKTTTPVHSALRTSDDQWRSGGRSIATSRQRRSSHYNPLSVCVTVTRQHTDRQLAALFAAGCRCVHVRLAFGRPPELAALMLLLLTEIAAHYLRVPRAPPIAVVIELRGRVVRTGRVRNDRPVQVADGSSVHVTANREYADCGVANVMYLSNFEPYLRRLAVGDFIFVDRSRIQLVIVKVTHTVGTVECCVLRGGQLGSYMDVVLPYVLRTADTDSAPPQLNADERADIEFARQFRADYVVVPGVSDPLYLRAVRERLVAGGREACAPRMLCQVDVAAMNIADDRTTQSAEWANALVNDCDGLWWDRPQRGLSRAEGELVCVARRLLMPVVMAMGRPRPTKEHSFMLIECDCFLLKQFTPYIRAEMQRRMRRRHEQPQQQLRSNGGADDADASGRHNELVQQLKQKMLQTREFTSVVLNCSVLASLMLDAQMIICVTANGATPIRLSYDRPKCPILAVCDVRALARRLAVYKNVIPVVYVEGRDGGGGAEDEDGGGGVIKQEFPAPAIDRHAEAMARIQKRLQFGQEIAIEMGAIIVGDLVIFCYDSFGNVESSESTGTSSFQCSYVSEDMIKCI